MTLRVFPLATEGAEWDRRLAELPRERRDVYFSAGYHLLWERNGDGEAFGAAYAEAGGTVMYPFLLRPLAMAPGSPGMGEAAGQWDISSAYGYGGPLVHAPGAEAATLAGFRRELAAWCRDNHVVSEFVRFHPLLQTERGMEQPVDGAPPLDVIPANATVWCRLSSPEEHVAAMSSSARRNLRKALRSGLVAVTEQDDDAYDRFQELYVSTMRRRGAAALYLFPKRYFADCRELLGDSQALLTVRRPPSPDGTSGALVAGGLFLLGPTTLHYHLGGSDPAALADRPNNLLFAAAMDWGAARGLTALHLGGGFRAGGDDELLRFKAGFSDLRARFHMGRCVHDEAAYAAAVARRAAAGGGDPGGFFPAYRAPLGAGR